MKKAIADWRAKNLSDDEIRTAVEIGFCQPKFYKPSSWKRAKALMDEIICPSGWAFPYDFGRGKGKYESSLDNERVVINVLKLLKAGE